MLVKGGPANSGIKRPLKPKGQDWTCQECGQQLRGYWGNCPNCGERRPK